jgi:two-component system OmpR family sensor kinase
MLDEQEALEARLRQFVADASHELRTPVSAIQGFLQLWQQGHLREGPKFDDAVRRIGQESARMAGLVEDLLTLARLDEGQPLVRDKVDLVRLVDDVVLAAYSTHPSRHIRIEGDGAAVVSGDPRALRQVIANLVTNALIHTPLTASVTICVTACPGAVQVEVADTGPGMDAESAAHAFDRFWRGDASRSRAGSGLGLPIVGGIVAAHGGQLKMETAPGEGTVVQVVLPVA